MNAFEIVPYDHQHKAVVKELNYVWLKKYDLWEPLDDEYLDNPEAKVLNQGGIIFLAKHEGAIVGTIFVVPTNVQGTVEICKFCVSEHLHGHGIGKSLMTKAIENTKENGTQTVILYSNRKLQNALKLYEKLGFQFIEDFDGKYDASDIKMMLKL